jgi:hypothetical protein
MEQPFLGIAKVTESIQGIRIEIPSKKYWALIAFLLFWLLGWLMGELFAISVLFMGEFNFSSFFIMLWFLGWTTGGFFVIKIITWMILGAEIIVIDSMELSIQKKGNIFFKKKVYDVREVKNFMVNPKITFDNALGISYNRNMSYNAGGGFKFSYGFKTIQLATALDDSEAEYLFELIKSKRFFTK